MNVHAWVARLVDQLPGWHIWYTSGGGMPRGWYAVPAPADTEHVKALALPGRIFAKTPASLRSLARERYGWDDTCESCGVLARKCGHRQPEREGARPLRRPVHPESCPTCGGELDWTDDRTGTCVDCGDET